MNQRTGQIIFPSAQLAYLLTTRFLIVQQQTFIILYDISHLIHLCKISITLESWCISPWSTPYFISSVGSFINYSAPYCTADFHLSLKVLNFWKFTSYCSLKPLWSGHGGSSASSYLDDPTSPIPSHCASIVATSTLRVNYPAPYCTADFQIITLYCFPHLIHQCNISITSV